MKPYWKQIGLGAGEQYRRFERLREAAVACGLKRLRVLWVPSSLIWGAGGSELRWMVAGRAARAWKTSAN